MGVKRPGRDDVNWLQLHIRFPCVPATGMSRGYLNLVNNVRLERLTKKSRCIQQQAVWLPAGNLRLDCQLVVAEERTANAIQQFVFSPQFLLKQLTISNKNEQLSTKLTYIRQ